MTNKEIYEYLVSDTMKEPFRIVDDEGVAFLLDPLGYIPMHDVIYAVMDLLEINDLQVSEEEAGLVIFELDFDEESDTYYVETVEDDELFDEVIEAFNSLPVGE